MSKQRPDRLLWVMFMAYFTFGLMGVLGALTPDIIADFHLSRFSAALLGSSVFLALGLFAIPSGFLADRLGARRVILSGVSLMALGCLLVSQSRSYGQVLIMIFAVGIGTTMLQTSGSPLVQKLDAPEKYHRNLTFTIAFATFGASSSTFLLAYIRGMGRPWQVFYLLFAFICAGLFAVLAFSRFPPRAPDTGRIRLDQMGKLLRNPILLTYGIGVYVYTAAEAGTFFWIPKFFEDVHGIPAAASNIHAATFLGRVFPSPALVYAIYEGMLGLGRVLGGLMLNWLGSRKVLRFYSVMTLISLLAAIFGSTTVTIIGFAACGFFSSVLYPLIYSGTINSFSEHQGTISGLLCTSYISAAVMWPVQGWVGDHIGMRAALMMPAVGLVYVVGLAWLGRARYD